MPKSTESTVFVRFNPTPDYKVLRHQLEDVFSQIGPIRKSSWINSKNNESSKGYGFVKFLSKADAESASEELNDTKIQMEGKSFRMFVEMATLAEKSNCPKGLKDGVFMELSTPEARTGTEENGESLKKNSRIILRNLSFYAKEHHIHSVLEKRFGKVVDVHLPRVQSNLHVGFCFVTFSNPKQAQQAVQAKHIDIQKRTVSMDWSIPKNVHQQGGKLKKSAMVSKPAAAMQPREEDHKVNQIQNRSIYSKSENEEGFLESAKEVSQDKFCSEDGGSEEDLDSNNSVKEKRTIFLRNLPFDATRNDLFQLFAKFGFIESIYLVRDKDTKMLKGTAFITYRTPRSAKQAVEQCTVASANGEGNHGAASNNKEDFSSSEIWLRGRRIWLNFAVDRETASTFEPKEKSSSAADRRNMYLQVESRVDSTPSDHSADFLDTWDFLPEQDQKKRQSALKDKTTKLQSPIFFINPKRLSIRNLAKHIDEADLQSLCELATKRALKKGLVSTKDQIAHLRAMGEASTRKILAKLEDKQENEEDVIPRWCESKGIKDYIPSVYIDRDFGPKLKKSEAPSRGFGFVEFSHHVHALACLRELNNNSAYSREYVVGGKAADDLKRRGRRRTSSGQSNGSVRIPRLIVDFTVENKIKARKQAEKRLRQQMNAAKQREEGQKLVESSVAKKRNRGAIQREKKRQALEAKQGIEHQDVLQAKSMPLRRKIGTQVDSTSTKLPKMKSNCKRQKVDVDERKLDNLVQNHRKNFEVDAAKVDCATPQRREGKRWFD